jgi:hypothetical protein
MTTGPLIRERNATFTRCFHLLLGLFFTTMLGCASVVNTAKTDAAKPDATGTCPADRPAATPAVARAVGPLHPEGYNVPLEVLIAIAIALLPFGFEKLIARHNTKRDDSTHMRLPEGQLARANDGQAEPEDCRLTSSQSLRPVARLIAGLTSLVLLLTAGVSWVWITPGRELWFYCTALVLAVLGSLYAAFFAYPRLLDLLRQQSCECGGGTPAERIQRHMQKLESQVRFALMDRHWRRHKHRD